MTDLAVARRFYQAAVRAARHAGHGDHVPEVLVRLGLPGLAQRLDPEAAPADPAARRLHQLYDTLAAEEARRVGGALEAAGVEHFFAKGIALLGTLYRPGDRVISDLDLYVPGAAREAAVERLAALGYAPLADTDQSGPPALRSSLALTRAAGVEPEDFTVDLHWAVDPVRRLLPRGDRPIPPRFWRGAGRRDGLRVPAPEHHAALLVHHLVHTDLAHVRGLLDLALLFADLPADAGVEYRAAAEELGVGDFARAAAGLVSRDLGVHRPAAGANHAPALDEWLARVARSDPDDDARITRRRIMTRIRVLGWRSAPTLLADVVAPPAAFLAWRWPGRSVGGALARHYGQILKKALRP